MTTYSYDYYGSYYYDYGDEYMYPGYNFERPVYLYIWEILVVITCLQNCVVLSVFLRRKMRNCTTFILSAIAISDTLTGLVTLPSYIMVYQRYDPLNIYYYSLAGSNNSYNYTDISFFHSRGNESDLHLSTVQTNSHMSSENSTASPAIYLYHVSNLSGTNDIMHDNMTVSPTIYVYYQSNSPAVDGYILSKHLCRAFMISKYFLSKSFKTISIFLMLFLEIQRYISMAYPFRYGTCFNRFRIVKIYCFAVSVVCPLFHSFHLWSEKAENGVCQWELSEIGCGGGCIYLWIAVILRHFIPSVSMCAFTILFIRQLRIGLKNFRSLDSDSSQIFRREKENRRISIVVATIVIVRLIPEIPYCIYLLYNSVDNTVNNGREVDLETNRVIHMIYEIALEISYITHFYIYLIFNNSFRKEIMFRFITPAQRAINRPFSRCNFKTRSRMNATAIPRSGPACDEREFEMLHPEISNRSENRTKQKTDMTET